MKRNIIAVLFTVLVVVGVCYYLYTVNAHYDGGLINSLVPFVFTMPLIGAIGLWEIGTKKTTKPTSQQLWQKILSIIAYVIAVAVIAYYLVTSLFYDLSSIILAVLLVAVLPCAYFDYKKGGQLLKDPVLNWAAVMSGFYGIVFIIVFTYIQVVSPVTADQATALVAEKYGEDAYQFVGHLDFHVADNPIGVYWFSQRTENANGWVEVDLLTGDADVF